MHHLDQWTARLMMLRPGRDANWREILAVVPRAAPRGPIAAIEQYLGVRPEPRSYRVLTEAEWKNVMPTDRVDLVKGPLVAMTTPDGDVIVKHGHEGSAIHELLHVVGFRPEGISKLINEGITQAVAIAVARAAGLPADPSYRDQVRWVHDRLLPRTGMQDIQTFARGYVGAPNKGAYVRGLLNRE